ncbi:hypothetical protein evm_006044 [Chilo suppressalis]|nr:hypothetical protein evm_006044 [Chilo suppressalis]
MIVPRSRWCLDLRWKCFIVGYMNLIASIVDIGVHIAVVAIITSGFQCDPTEETVSSINWPWLEPFLLIINLGTHGFYPFPLLITNRNNLFVGYQIMTSQPSCYPGMLHINLIDFLNFLINMIWLKFVKEYVIGLHKKDLVPMRVFFSLSLVKLVLQIMYFTYEPDFRSVSASESYWFIKLVDILMASLALLVVYQYMKQLKAEKSQKTDQPPPYIECLISASVSSPQKVEFEEKKDTEVTIPEDKKEKNIENISERV